MIPVAYHGSVGSKPLLYSYILLFYSFGSSPVSIYPHLPVFSKLFKTPIGVKLGAKIKIRIRSVHETWKNRPNPTIYAVLWQRYMK